jgi:tRNA-specific 2-thiouridylase
VGQRRGLGLAAPRPLYVTRLDAGANRVVVGEADDLLAAGAELEGVSFVAGDAPREPLAARVQVRYRDAGTLASVEPLPGGRARVRFERPVRAVTPGQAAVFYDGDRVLGGGWITGAIA